jgi:hypothetical protein
MKSILTILAFLICSLCLAQVAAPSRRLADSMEQKINYIEQNGQAAHPSQTPVVMSEDEVNDYFADGRVKLPQGVKKVTFKGQSGVVTTMAVVDFDEIRQGQQSSNPMLSIFKGTNNVVVEADAAGAGRVGKVHVRTVTLNGVEVPKFALEYFVDKYIKPKYPNLGIDSEFQLPDKIDLASVGYHKVTVTQK